MTVALIPCPECKQMVSDRAAACPRCGLSFAGREGAALASAPPTPWTAPSPTAPLGQEEVVWEGGVSPRLLVREMPGMLWAVALTPIAIVALPYAIDIAGGLGRPVRVAIAGNLRVVRLVVIGAVLAASLLRLMRVAVRYLQLKTTRYRLTNQRLTIESGLVSRRVDDVDLRAVQDVALAQSPLERVLGVGRLEIVSSDSTRPHLTLYGIVDPADVRERLRASAYQASQRQVFTRST